MKTVTLLILISGLLLCANSTHARVGETEAQIDHRYGKPAGKWDDYIGYKKLYHWHGFDVMVTFLDGTSQREMFNKTQGPMEAQDQKYLTKISGVGQERRYFRQGCLHDQRVRRKIPGRPRRSLGEIGSEAITNWSSRAIKRALTTKAASSASI